MNQLFAVMITGLLLPFALWGQEEPMAKVQLDSTELLIGDQLHARIILNAPEGKEVIFPLVGSFWKAKNYEIVRITDQIKNNAEGGIQVVTQNVVLSFWDTGNYQLPPLPFTYTKGTEVDTTWAEAPMIRIDFPAGITGDSTYMAPIKPILEEHYTFMDYIYMALPFIGVTLLLLAVAFGVYFFTQWQQAMREKRKQLSPEELALKRLAELEESSYLAEKEFAAFHTEASSIIRTYLNQRFKIKALESPTSEIIPQVNYEHLEESLIIDLKEVLETADLVKFAKASPLDTANKFALQYIRRMVDYVQHQLDEEESIKKNGL
jgi:hypothetical protein